MVFGSGEMVLTAFKVEACIQSKNAKTKTYDLRDLTGVRKTLIGIIIQILSGHGGRIYFLIKAALICKQLNENARE